MKTISPLIIAGAVTAMFLAGSIDVAFAKGKGGGSRPAYSGSKHSSSHGGRYAGSSGSSHRGGSYKNARSGDQYGSHR